MSNNKANNGATGATAQQPNISNVPKKDANGKAIPGTSDGTLVRIRLFDDRERVLFFKENSSPTARQVLMMVGQKLELSDDAIPLFSLWIVCQDLELQIRPKMELREMVDKWPRWVEKYTHNSVDSLASSNYKFVFKREAMVHPDQERRIRDEAAIKLLYGEARNNVMSGRYPLSSATECFKLAALQLLITYGDYNSSKHGPGTQFINQSLGSVVPKYLMNKLKSSEWESKISQSWSELQKKSGITPYNDFLEIARQWAWYGATFFPACKNVPPQGYFELRTDHFLIAVNRLSLSIVDEDKHKVTWSGDFEGIEWECTPDSITIEYRPSNEKQESKRMLTTMITPQAHLIDSLASRSIHLIEKGLKNPVKKTAPGTVRGSKPSKLMTSTISESEEPMPPPPGDQPGGRRKSLAPPYSESSANGNSSNIEKRKSGDSRKNESRTMVTNDDEAEDNSANYLKAINEARKHG